MSKIEITVERKHSGLWLSTIHEDLYIKQCYVGYNLRQAKQDFRKVVKEELSKIIREIKPK